MRTPSDSPGRPRVGIVGAGFGGHVHAPAFAASGDFDVVAIASPNRAAAVAKTRKIEQSFDSLAAMLDGAEIDVVSIATPPYEHRGQVLAALARGKHVLCEKPFGLNVAECEEMVAAASAAGTVCALAHEFRYVPAQLATFELIRNGHLGALREIEIAWLGSWLRATGERPNSWFFERRRGGGITGAILSHLVDLARWLAASPVRRVAGFERTANPERGVAEARFASDVADGAFALLAYDGGVVARCTADATCAHDSSLVAAHGEHATAVSSGPSITQSATYVIDADEHSELELKESRFTKLAAARPDIPAFTDLVCDFARAIRGEEAPHLPRFADGLATQRVLTTIGYETASL